MQRPILQFGSARRLAVPADPAWMRSLLPELTIGTYLLLDAGKPIYVGRSDHCLATRLCGHEWLHRASHVAWEICPTPVRAFHVEAFWYDKLKARPGLLNRVHPARPAGHERPCPFCELDVDGVRGVMAGIGRRAKPGTMCKPV